MLKFDKAPASCQCDEDGDAAIQREYIDVVADYLPDGTVRPVSIKVEDGQTFAIAGIISVIHMSATKRNGAETRYYVRIGDREHYLFFEDAPQNRGPRWFVETKRYY